MQSRGRPTFFFESDALDEIDDTFPQQEDITKRNNNDADFKQVRRLWEKGSKQMEKERPKQRSSLILQLREQQLALNAHNSPIKSPTKSKKQSTVPSVNESQITNGEIDQIHSIHDRTEDTDDGMLQNEEINDYFTPFEQNEKKNPVVSSPFMNAKTKPSPIDSELFFNQQFPPLALSDFLRPRTESETQQTKPENLRFVSPIARTDFLPSNDIPKMNERMNEIEEDFETLKETNEFEATKDSIEDGFSDTVSEVHKPLKYHEVEEEIVDSVPSPMESDENETRKANIPSLISAKMNAFVIEPKQTLYSKGSSKNTNSAETFRLQIKSTFTNVNTQTNVRSTRRSILPKGLTDRTLSLTAFIGSAFEPNVDAIRKETPIYGTFYEKYTNDEIGSSQSRFVPPVCLFHIRESLNSKNSFFANVVFLTKPALAKHDRIIISEYILLTDSQEEQIEAISHQTNNQDNNIDILKTLLRVYLCVKWEPYESSEPDSNNELSPSSIVQNNVLAQHALQSQTIIEKTMEVENCVFHPSSQDDAEVLLSRSFLPFGSVSSLSGEIVLTIHRRYNRQKIELLKPPSLLLREKVTKKLIEIFLQPHFVPDSEDDLQMFRQSLSDFDLLGFLCDEDIFEQALFDGVGWNVTFVDLQPCYESSRISPFALNVTPLTQMTVDSKSDKIVLPLSTETSQLLIGHLFHMRLKKGVPYGGFGCVFWFKEINSGKVFRLECADELTLRVIIDMYFIFRDYHSNPIILRLENVLCGSLDSLSDYSSIVLHQETNIVLLSNDQSFPRLIACSNNVLIPVKNVPSWILEKYSLSFPFFTRISTIDKLYTFKDPIIKSFSSDENSIRYYCLECEFELLQTPFSNSSQADDKVQLSQIHGMQEPSLVLLCPRCGTLVTDFGSQLQIELIFDVNCGIETKETRRKQARDESNTKKSIKMKAGLEQLKILVTRDDLDLADDLFIFSDSNVKGLIDQLAVSLIGKTMNDFVGCLTISDTVEYCKVL